MSDLQNRAGLNRAVMKELLDNEELVNGTILTEDGGVFKVHLEILAGMSPFFKRIISAAQDTPWESILIPETSKEIVGIFIHFMYTGELQISLDKVRALTKTAELLEMPDVTKLCRRYLLSILNDENCITIYTFAKYSQYSDLKEAVRAYILLHFQQIFPVSNDYLNLEADDLVIILSSDLLNIKGEEYVFWAIIRWVEHDPETRKKSLPALLRCIRFGLCNTQFCERNIWSHPLVSGNEDCQFVALQASELFADLPNSRQRNALLDLRHPFLRPRTPAEVIFVMGGWSAGSATNVIETYDVKSERWFLSLTVDNVPRAYHGMLWHKGYIYVLGGFDGNQCFNSVRRFDPTLHTWEERGCMYVQRCYVSVAAVGDHLYAMGGYDGHRRSKSCERYDPATNQWKMVASMIHVRSDASADALKGKIYIAGGFNGQNVLNSAECYDPTTDEWTHITDMNSPRSGVKLVAYCGFLYIIGGFNGSTRLSTVEKYDLKTRQWIPVASMRGPRSNFATAVLFDCLYVIGGFNGLSTIASSECYDYQKNCWTPVTELNLNRSALAACTVTGINNAHEYTFLEGEKTTDDLATLDVKIGSGSNSGASESGDVFKKLVEKEKQFAESRLEETGNDERMEASKAGRESKELVDSEESQGTEELSDTIESENVI